jgi:glyoxylase-like metal-dependent hydrolase (beta-lactamase superfamily II)
VVYTHGHVDHAYGSWALLEAGERPEIVATEALPRRFERYIRLRGVRRQGRSRAASARSVR